MANPQLENGYIKISNEIIDALALIRIPGEARQVFDVILRRTYGYNKKEDAISLSQFSLKTGLPRSLVCRAIIKLETMRLVVIIKKETSSITKYRINKDFEKWVPLSKKRRGVSKKIISVIKKDNIRYQKRDTQKTVLKDNNTIEASLLSDELLENDNAAPAKTKPPSDVTIVRDYFYSKFKEVFQKEYIAVFGKDGKTFKDLLATVPVDEMISLIDKYFKETDQFIVNSGYSVGVFRVKINYLRATKKDSTQVNYGAPVC